MYSSFVQPSIDRKTRTKLRKPKYASLRHHPTTTTTTTTAGEQKQLINLFPLHPENLVEQLQYNFCDDKAATTLTGILASQISDDDDEERTRNDLSPASVNYDYDDREVEMELVRAAMRGKKGDEEEKWVFYSEVGKRKVGGIPVSSSSLTSGFCWCDEEKWGKLVLKLDNEKIMKTWVDKGPQPKYIGEEKMCRR